MLPGFVDVTEGRRISEDDNKKILRPIMSKKYERTKSAHKPEEKAHQILTPAAARAIRKVTKADEKKDDEEKE